jgi:diguanylate cyclase (GGDEF)-like protein
MPAAAGAAQANGPATGPGRRWRADEITALLPRSLRWLLFPRALERQFVADQAAQRLRHSLASLVIGLFIFNGFLMVDRLMTPDTFALAAQLRLGIVTPMGLAVLALGWALRHRATPLVMVGLETVIALSTLIASATVGFVAASSNEVLAGVYPAGFVIVIIYGNVVQRARFWFALATSVGVLAIHVVSSRHMGPQAIDLGLALTLFIAVTLAFSLVANYAMEREERLRYLLRLRGQALTAELNDTHDKLQRLARLDALTGLANRRYFEEYLDQIWARARHDGAEVAVLMLDLDHFKAYNDRHGHPAGDVALQRVAAAARASLRQPMDLLARYGGEEFIAVLPQASLADALLAAERVRQAVHDLALRHEDAPGGVLTVSVGAAVLRAGPPPGAGASAGATVPPPPEDGLETARLIEQADAALYAAKAAGRNGVRPLPHPGDAA